MTTPPSQSPAPAEDQAASPYPEIPAEATAPAKKKGKVGKLLLRFVAIVVIGVIALFVKQWLTGDPSIAEAGNCVHNSGSDTKPDVKIVDCGGSDAEFKVLKVVRNTDSKACDSVEDLVASYVVKSSDSYTLCLGDNKK